MNREIKFRVWDNLNDKYFEPTHRAYEGELEYLQLGMNGRVSRVVLDGMRRIDIQDESLFPGVYTIERYTGLKDKNSVEIYEGDVVKIYDTDSFIKIVTFAKGAFGFRDHEIGFIPFAAYERPKVHLEVIGNIHQHSHLLGGVDK